MTEKDWVLVRCFVLLSINVDKPAKAERAEYLRIMHWLYKEYSINLAHMIPQIGNELKGK